MAIFGMKTKKLAKFGSKFAKAGLFGLKNGGRLAFAAGTMTGSPQLLAAGKVSVNAMRQGIEKMR
tara:strand:- start:388 stop:582 length:195 start_codon:yes stop_codon:yes gene_type:complete